MDLCNLHCLLLFPGIIERIQIFKIWKAEQDFLSNRVFRVAAMMSEMAELLLIERHHHVPVPFYTSSLCILPKWYVVMLTLKCFRTLIVYILLWLAFCNQYVFEIQPHSYMYVWLIHFPCFLLKHIWTAYIFFGSVSFYYWTFMFCLLKDLGRNMSKVYAEE